MAAPAEASETWDEIEKRRAHYARAELYCNDLIATLRAIGGKQEHIDHALAMKNVAAEEWANAVKDQEAFQAKQLLLTAPSVGVVDNLSEGLVKPSALHNLFVNGRHTSVLPVYTHQRGIEIPDTPENRALEPDLDAYNAEVRRMNAEVDKLEAGQLSVIHPEQREKPEYVSLEEFDLDKMPRDATIVLIGRRKSGRSVASV